MQSFWWMVFFAFVLEYSFASFSDLSHIWLLDIWVIYTILNNFCYNKDDWKWGCKAVIAYWWRRQNGVQRSRVRTSHLLVLFAPMKFLCTSPPSELNCPLSRAIRPTLVRVLTLRLTSTNSTPLIFSVQVFYWL